MAEFPRYNHTVKGYDLNQGIYRIRIDGRPASDYILKKEFQYKFPRLTCLFAHTEARFQVNQGSTLRIDRLGGDIFFDGMIMHIETGTVYKRLYARDTRA